MRILLFGAGGMLGHDLVDVAPADAALIDASAGGVRCDLTDHAAVAERVREVAPDIVVNAAGYTAVDRAEDEPARAEAVNGAGVAHLAACCRAQRATLVHFSSDYVFSGRAAHPYREDDAPDPIGIYGRSKLAGERGIADSGASALVIRTQWLFGAHGRSFPRTMLDRARQRLATRVVNDQVGRPTFTADLAAWTWALIGQGARGTIHAANEGTATWYDVARMVFDHAGASECVTPCTTADYPVRAARPAYSVLDVTRLTALVGPVPDWRDALRRYLAANLAAN